MRKRKAVESISHNCEKHSHACQPIAVVGTIVVLLLIGLARTVMADPIDDHRRGEQAYRGGDVVTAMGALRSAANLGYAPSQVLLADILDRAEFDEEAMGWYRKAAEQGNPDGEYGLGSMYLAGEGVKKDTGQAWFWFSRAAEQNHGPAIIAMADANIRAQSGEEMTVRPDTSKAAVWLHKAAEIGYLPAIAALALAFREGRYGIEPDAKQAERFSTLAESLRKKNAGARAVRRR